MGLFFIIMKSIHVSYPVKSHSAGGHQDENSAKFYHPGVTTVNIFMDTLQCHKYGCVTQNAIVLYLEKNAFSLQQRIRILSVAIMIHRFTK